MADPLIPYLVYGLIGLVLVIGIGIAISLSKANARRVGELEMFARSAGLQPCPEGVFESPYTHTWLGEILDPTAGETGFSLLAQLQNFEPFGRGHSPYVRNLIAGNKENIGWFMFDYHFTEGSGRDETSFHYAIIAAQIPYVFPRLVLKPENIFLKLGEHLGLQDIHFEVNEFNQRYHVTCSDEKRAFDILCPQTIEYLLTVPARWWQFFGNYLVIAQQTSLQASMCYEVMNEVEGFLSKIPDYVREDVGLMSEPSGTSD